MSANSGPGYAKHPDHRVETQPANLRVRVIFEEEIVADTHNAIRLEESGYRPVFYIPREDVKMERLARTGHRTYCPYKGEASHYTLSSGGRSEPNAVWSYERPYDEVDAIREYLAFYPKRVDRIETLPE